MNPYKARKIAKWIAIIIIIAMIVTSFSFIFFIPSMMGSEGYVVYAEETNDLTDEELMQKMSNLKEYMKYIKDNYKDPVTLDMLMNGAFEGVTESLDDPYSIYYREDSVDDFINYLDGKYPGLGLRIQLVEGKCKVLNVFKGSPAEKAGIHPEDTITKVNNITTQGKTLDEILGLIKGELGTSVQISIDRNSSILIYNLKIELIQMNTVEYKLLENGIGYLEIIAFQNETDQEFKEAMSQLKSKGMKAIIIDVRDNLGGNINVTVNIADQIMPAGVVLYLKKQGNVEQAITTEGTKERVPMVLLVNEESASASEVLAAALQDSKTAILVGTTTYGKGVVQTVLDVGDDSMARVSTAYWLTPNKRNINKVGITPDYVVANYSKELKPDLLKAYKGFAPMIENSKPKKGDMGLNVFGAQQRLSLLGYTVELNGLMDDKTVTAISAFQKQSGLNPYGVLDNTTKSRLDNEALLLIYGLQQPSEDLQLKKAIELLK